MEFTGERFIPSCKGAIALEHLHRYLMATNFVHNKVVLDIACGEGYGCQLLSARAEHVYGVDLSKEIIGHAKEAYQAIENIEFIQGDCSNIPLPDNSVDFVSSFETIEHIDKQEQMLAEIVRVLKPNGMLFISSPDKRVYSDIPNYQNPFHVKELYRREFEDLVELYFESTLVLTQKVIFGSLISSECLPNSSSNNYYQDGDVINPSVGLHHPPYILILAGSGPAPILASSLFESPLSESEIFISLERQIETLTQEINKNPILRMLGKIKRLVG